ncbi:unnamed protein product [Closterium sp. NIES-54]
MRNLLRGMRLPNHQWHEELDHAVMLHNLLSSSSLPNNASPHLLWTGKLGNTKMLRVLGCMVQYRPHTARARRFSQRAQWGLHLGIEKHYNAWKIFDVHLKETVAARDVIFYERLTLQTYLDNVAANRDLTGSFRGNRAFALAADEADWDEQNVDGASEDAGALPYFSVDIPMDDDNPPESVNAETYFDFADNGYVTPQTVDTNVSERIGPNFLPDPEAGDEEAYPEDANLPRYTQSGLHILSIFTPVLSASDSNNYCMTKGSRCLHAAQAACIARTLPCAAGKRPACASGKRPACPAPPASALSALLRCRLLLTSAARALPLLRVLASLPLSNCCCRPCLAVEATVVTAAAASRRNSPCWCLYRPSCCRYSPCCCRSSPCYCSYSPAGAATALAAAATAPAAAAPAPVTTATALLVQLQPLLLLLQPLLLQIQPLLLQLQPCWCSYNPCCCLYSPCCYRYSPCCCHSSPCYCSYSPAGAATALAAAATVLAAATTALAAAATALAAAATALAVAATALAAAATALAAAATALAAACYCCIHCYCC